MRYFSKPGDGVLLDVGADTPEEAAKVIRDYVWKRATDEARSVTLILLPPCPVGDLGKSDNVQPLSTHQLSADEDGRIDDGLERCLRHPLPIRVEIEIEPLGP